MGTAVNLQVSVDEVQTEMPVQRSLVFARISATVSCYALIGILAWVNFPLGSNRPWSWSLLALLVSAAWLLWIPYAVIRSDETLGALRKIAIPSVVFVIVLAWAVVQALPDTPMAWHNAIWQVLPSGAGANAPGAISMNPFVTMTEVMKLATYLCFGLLVYTLARDATLARRFFSAVVIVGACYALYGFALSLLGTSQGTILEHMTPPYGRDVTGAFVNKNSFATFTGIVLIVALLDLFEASESAIIRTRGTRVLVSSLIQYLMGRGALRVLACAILFLALVLADSRAGLMAALAGLMTLVLLSGIVAARRGSLARSMAGAGAIFAVMAVLFFVSGASLQDRFDQLMGTQGVAELRPVLWADAEHAIADHALLGTGLGTFRDAYSLYAQEFEPYIVDKVHNDYLELALGLGIPAAIAWVFALAWLLATCVRGVFHRRRRRVYALAAVSATMLVAFHSLFDFSLQIPAVSILFATVMGIGLAQSFRSDERALQHAAAEVP
jgi:O-antigen ligase